MRWTLGLAVFLVGCAGASRMKRGDTNALKGEWKAALENYESAAEADPQTQGLAEKIENARRRAIDQAVSLAKLCLRDSDLDCVEREATFVLGIEPANETVAVLRVEARARLAEEALRSAKAAGQRSDFVTMLRELANHERIQPGGAEERARVISEFAPAASAWAASVAELPADAEATASIEQIGSAIEVVKVLPSRDEVLLAKLRARENQFKDRIEAERARVEREREAERAEAERERRKEQANRNRTVTFAGAMVQIAKASGAPWDGMGGAVNPQNIAKLAAAAGAAAPAAAVAGILGNLTNQGTRPPDPVGSAELFVRGKSVPVRLSDGTDSTRFLLFKRQDSYAPTWSNVAWRGIDINEARLRVSLVDADLSESDDIGIIELGPEALKSASETEGVLWIDVTKQTNGQVLLVGISVF